MSIRILLLNVVVVATLSMSAIHGHEESASLSQNECVPCSSTSSVMSGSRRGRQLKLFSKLREAVKDALMPRSHNDNADASPLSPSDTMGTFITSDFFMGNNETTIGQIFLTINSNPILKFGAYALALAVILPLIALEATSIATSTPIICILNLSDTTPFMGPCSDFERKRIRRRFLVTGHLDETFLQSYFNGTVESLRIPDMAAADGNVTVQLMKIVDYGLSNDVFDIMNNVTITNVVTEIASSNSTRPFLTATVLAVLPVLIVNRVETETCSGDHCTRRHRRRSLSASPIKESTDDTRSAVAVTVDETCEMEYIHCQIQNMLVLFNQ